MLLPARDPNHGDPCAGKPSCKKAPESAQTNNSDRFFQIKLQAVYHLLWYREADVRQREAIQRFHAKMGGVEQERLSIPLFRPYQKLISITIRGKKFSVPENQMLLRAFQYLCPDTISYGRYCWNEECQYCRVSVKRPDG